MPDGLLTTTTTAVTTTTTRIHSAAEPVVSK